MATIRVEAKQEATAPKKRVRIPFSGFSYKLEVAHKDPGYFYYWQKDVGDNLERMLLAGYEFVTRRQAGRELPPELTNKDIYGGKESLDDRLSVFGGRDEFGREYRLFLMRQPLEYHEEDEALARRRADAVDESIRRQNFGGSTIAQKYGEVRVET